MVIVAVGTLLFWAGWASWAGASLTLKGATLRTRMGGTALMLSGVAGLVLGLRLLAS